MVERLQPDILVLDLLMPDLNGFEVAQQVIRILPGIEVVILSMHSDVAYVAEALRVGARGYVSKARACDDLMLAVREVAAGRRYLSPPISEHLVEIYTQKAGADVREDTRD